MSFIGHFPKSIPKAPRFVLAFLTAPTGAISLCCMSVLALIAVAGPSIFGHAADTLRAGMANLGPTMAHPLGTDALGRDELARVMLATRLSVTDALLAAGIAAVCGITIGSAVSLAGPRARFAGKRVIDAALGIPDILVAILIVVVLGSGGVNAAMAVGIANWPFFGRLTTTLVTDVRAKDFVQAASALGVRKIRLALRYIFPNIAGTLIVAFGVAVSGALLEVSTLSFLGLGVQPPQIDWGSMLSSGISSIYEQPLLALAPAFMLVFGGLAANIFGDAAGRAANPMQWTPRARRRRRPAAAPVTPQGVAHAVASCDPVTPSPTAVIEVRNLTVEFGSGLAAARPVRGVDLVVRANERVGIVGESGSGKTLTAQALGRLLGPPALVSTTVFRVTGKDVSALGRRAERRLYGRGLAMVFQDPSASLNPVLRVGTQMTEGPRTHRGLSRKAAMTQAVKLLDEVGLQPGREKLVRYPHELSGGMRQRVVIAMGLGNQPLALIADEPTTALDVTVQSQVLRTLDKACSDHGMALLLISHNMAVVAQLCERILVMYGGRIVEEMPTEVLQRDGARHPYSRALLAAIPQIRRSARHADPHSIPGDPPDAARADAGCSFAERCPLVLPRCRSEVPRQVEVAARHRVACWLFERADT